MDIHLASAVLQANSHFHRRCYWLLTDPRVIMVHYLNTEGMEISRTKSTRKGRGSNRQTAQEPQRSTPRPRNAPTSKGRTKAAPSTVKTEPTMPANPIPVAVPVAMQTDGFFDAGLDETSLVSMRQDLGQLAGPQLAPGHHAMKQ